MNVYQIQDKYPYALCYFICTGTGIAPFRSMLNHIKRHSIAHKDIYLVFGTPFCVTVDHQSKEDQTVTIRYRDTMLQERVKISEVKDIVLKSIQGF